MVRPCRQEEGLRPLPTVNYPDKTEGVTLKCSRIQETVRSRVPPNEPPLTLNV